MIKNLTALYGLHFFKYLIPLMLIPYLTRTLGLVVWGELAIAQAFSAYLILLIEYGFEFSATKKLAKNKSSSTMRAIILSEVMGAKVLLIFIAILISLPFLFLLDVFIKNNALYYYSILFVVSASFNFTWYFQGIEQLVIATFVDITLRVISVIFIIFYIKDPKDVNLLLFIYSLSSILVTIILIFIINKNTTIKLPSFRGSINGLKNGWDMFLYKLSVSFYTTGNTLILSFFVAPEIVALYSGAEKISKSIIGLLTPITQVLFPRLNILIKTSYKDAESLFKKSILFMGLIGLLMSISIFLSSDLLVSIILGKEFMSASSILQVLAILPILITISNVLGIQWMIPNGMEKAFNKIIIISGILNLSLAVILTPYFQAIGMAWSVVIAELLVTLMMGFYLWNNQDNLHQDKVTKGTLHEV